MSGIRLGKGGFTLIEMIFVLAIILILVSFIIPIAMEKVRDVQFARANADIQTIYTTLILFQIDLGIFPVCDDENCDPVDFSAQTLRFLAFGDGTDDIQDTFPADDPNLFNKWDLLNTNNISDFPKRNNAFNHFGQNDPNADNVSGSDIAGVRDYKESDGTGKSKVWKGPYVANVSLDPWGHTYIVHVGAMEENGIPVIINSLQNSLGSFDRPEGWILSAGPDGLLQTSPTDTVLSGDDIGFIIFTSKLRRDLRNRSPLLFEPGRFPFRVTPIP